MKELKSLIPSYELVVNVEVPAGGVIKLNEEWVKCVAYGVRRKSCEKCCLYGSYLCLRMVCDCDVRKDGLDVFFTNIDEVVGRK